MWSIFLMRSYVLERHAKAHHKGRVFVAKIFITKACFFFATDQPLWCLFTSPLVTTNTRLINTLVMIFCSPQMVVLFSDELWCH